MEERPRQKTRRGVAVGGFNHKKTRRSGSFRNPEDRWREVERLAGGYWSRFRSSHLFSRLLMKFFEELASRSFLPAGEFTGTPRLPRVVA